MQKCYDTKIDMRTNNEELSRLRAPRRPQKTRNHLRGGVPEFRSSNYFSWEGKDITLMTTITCHILRENPDYWIPYRAFKNV